MAAGLGLPRIRNGLLQIQKHAKLRSRILVDEQRALPEDAAVPLDCQVEHGLEQWVARGE